MRARMQEFLRQRGRKQTLFAWGSNDRGQCGDGSIKSRQLVPVGVKDSRWDDSRFRHVACGYRSSFAVMEDGRMFSWGDGQSGQLGHADLTEGLVATPMECAAPTLLDISVKDVLPGLRHTLFLTHEGMLFGCGDNTFGQVGLSIVGEGIEKVSRTVTQVQVNGEKIVSAAVGYDHSLALTSGGQLYAWGQNTWGQCDSSSSIEVIPAPMAVELPPGCEVPMSVVAGEDCSAVVDVRGKLFIWGDGYDDAGTCPAFQGAIKQVLMGSKDIVALNMQGTLMRYTQGKVEVLHPTLRFLQIGRGPGFTYGVTTDHNVVSWGLVGRLGDGRVERDPTSELRDAAIGDDEQLEPCAVPLFQGRHCVMLAAGPTHCLAVFEEQT